MERSYLIQSPKFSWVWSQSHQRIANNWIKARAIFIVDAHRDNGGVRCAGGRKVDRVSRTRIEDSRCRTPAGLDGVNNAQNIVGKIR
jgi:hypothetical protein